MAARASSAAQPAVERHVRGRWSLSIFASVMLAAFMFVTVMGPQTAFTAAADAQADDAPARFATGAGQSLVSSGAGSTATRDDYQIIKPPPPPPKPTAGAAPAAGTPDPGTAQAIAYDMVAARGWGPGEYDCLVALWKKESGWNTYAYNAGSGAYGIPQALPGSKMASAGADWATNPATQITWGLGYISARYQSPCGAWAHSGAKGWY